MKFTPFIFGFFLMSCCGSATEVESSTTEITAGTELIVESSDSMIAVETIDTLNICSFNIQFLGSFKNRQDSALSQILVPYDIVVIQELVSPPCDGVYPDGSTYSADDESASFVGEMEEQGFSYWLSEEDTGPKKNHNNSTGSEWWITFYRAEKVLPDSSRFYGFLDTTRILNANFDRVPYAFPFKSVDGRTDFTLISVHLKPGDGRADRARRQHELVSLFDWVDAQNEENLDFITLGDCNIYKLEEFVHFEAEDMFSLNRECKSTNTKLYELASKGRPYDHVFYQTATEEDLVGGSFRVEDLMGMLKPCFESPFPYEPYVHDTFRTRFSDHVPVSFKMLIGTDTD
ncbi:MAG: hypothetical protein QNK23_13055 [Crocinitomicaceae bacterium]|nr:hypothetical protein [Crocinitomicaceae bacterium]